MIERLSAQENNSLEEPPTFTLRKATEEDLPFLFRVSSDAMKPVRDILNQGVVGEEERFAEYKKKFDPEKIEVIQYQGRDVGRLRVVRSADSIYVGGIQILPEFQGKGIGTSLFTDLVKESRQSKLPIVLEVHDVNTEALAFYKKLGFTEGEKVGNQTVMRFVPSQ